MGPFLINYNTRIIFYVIIIVKDFNLCFCRFGAPEAMFQPHLIGRDEVGVAELLFNTINAADVDTRWV